MAHGAPVPHAQPVAVHASVRTGSHATHAAPPVPQLVVLGTLHVSPEQQPLAHVAMQPVHAPAAQLPPPQGSHAPPPAPHAVGESPARHVAPSQQPAHETPSQMHAPETQC